MVKRRAQAPGMTNPDLTAMMDLVFNIIAFFVMINTFQNDEAAQRVKLPTSQLAAILDEDRIPDSLSISVDGANKVLSWGLEMDVRTAAGAEQFTKFIRNEAGLQKERQGPNWQKDGLSTTVILRVDGNAEYEIFRKIMDLARAAGFRKFQMKAQGPDDKPAAGEG
ncbi:MAG: ExbD/TolR family protein [Planctomycetia bacterium]